MACLRAESERNQYPRTSQGVIEKVIRSSFAVVNHRVPGIKTRHDAPGRVEFENAAEIKGEVSETFVLELEGEHSSGAGLNIFSIALTKTHYSRPAFCEDAPLLKALAGLDPKQPLRDVAVAVAVNSASAASAFMRKEISFRFEGDASVEVESKPPAKTWLRSAAVVTRFRYGSECGGDFELQRLIRLRLRPRNAR